MLHAAHQDPGKSACRLPIRIGTRRRPQLPGRASNKPGIAVEHKLQRPSPVSRQVVSRTVDNSASLGNAQQSQLNSARKLGRIFGSRKNDGFWQAMKMLLSELSCPPIRKHRFKHGGFRDVADLRYHGPRFPSPIYDFPLFRSLDGSARAPRDKFALAVDCLRSRLLLQVDYLSAKNLFSSGPKSGHRGDTSLIRVQISSRVFRIVSLARDL